MHFEKDKNERFVRWQNYRIEQLSFSINLFLGFAVASLAYAINIKITGTLSETELLLYSIKCWSVSAGLGVVATVIRLLDFRYTAKKIISPNKYNSVMAKYSGSITWGAFWGQLLSYLLGAYFFISIVYS